MVFNVDFINTRVLVLLIILLFFLIVALVIVAMEFRIKKHHRKKVIQKIESTRLMSLSKDMKKAKNIEAKLSVIDRHAKRLFSERHHVSTNKSYAELQKIFDQKQAYEYSEFCKKMFEAYYSNEHLQDKHVKSILRTLTKLIRETEIYLDPDKYDPDKLYAKHEKETKEHTQSRSHKKIEKEQEKLLSKQSEVQDKNKLLKAREKELSQKERSLNEREKQSQKMLRALEEKIKVQEEKIKEQEKLQEKLEKTLGVDEKQKVALKEQKQKHREMKKEFESQRKRNWRESIDDTPIDGKEWVKKKTKRRRVRYS